MCDILYIVKYMYSDEKCIANRLLTSLRNIILYEHQFNQFKPGINATHTMSFIDYIINCFENNCMSYVICS